MSLGMSKLPVSVLIIAQNVANSLRRCLDSVKDFEEVVLVDGGSDDETIAIAQEYANVKVYHNPWPGFLAQRNLSLDKASHDWCLMVDADEEVAPDTVEYIRKIIASEKPKKMYCIVRTEYFEGIAIEHGVGKSDYQERLFQTKHIRYTGGVHHEHLLDGELLRPGNPEMEKFPTHLRIHHWPEYSLDDWLRKFPRFAYLVANEKISKGRRTNELVVLLSFFGSFFQLYRKSWRQGRMGFLMSVLESLSRCMVRCYIYNHQHFRKEGNKDFEAKYLR